MTPEKDLRLAELDALEKWLKKFCEEHPPFRYTREDTKEWEYYTRHQIKVYAGRNFIFDAICQRGSYGYEQGLLEIRGRAVINQEDEDGYDVLGWLKARDVIRRFKHYLWWWSDGELGEWDEQDRRIYEVN